MDSNNYSEPASIALKIIGALIAFFSFRWMIKIFKGKDGEFSMNEFLKFSGFIFFLTAAGYMLYKEGNREHQWYIYSEWYVAIVFGALLTVLHLDGALDKIVQLFKAIKSSPAPTTEESKA